MASHDRLDVLVNCAGVFLKERSETEDGIERTFATNHLAYFLLTHELIPALERAAPSRVVNVASKYGKVKVHFEDLMVKERPYSFLKATPQTMVARVMFTQTLGQRLEARGVSVNAVHPGLVKHTNLLNGVGGFFRVLTNLLGKSHEQGAETAVWLATSPEAAGQTGKLWFRRKALPTRGMPSDPVARQRLWDESVRLTGTSDWA
jgi:NAD(P)-dependent dehydrogenase (short-subunit alcohol dehydrogenase family)